MEISNYEYQVVIVEKFMMASEKNAGKRFLKLTFFTQQKEKEFCKLVKRLSMKARNLVIQMETLRIREGISVELLFFALTAEISF